MKADLSFGIVGCGKIGVRHAEQIDRVAKLISVCDIDVAKADDLANTYQIPSYKTLAELLYTQPDVVAICTPNGLHAQQTIQAFEAGCHVVCEKPMALTSDDCFRMIDAANKTNRQLFVVKQNRFNEAVIAVKKLLDDKAFGKIYSFQINGFWNRNADYYKNGWHGTKDLDGGTLFTQFSHFIDLLYWFLGEVDSVQSYLANAAHQNLIQTEDTGVAILKMKNGAIGTLNYTVNSFAENMEGSITLFGEKGTVKIGGQYLNTISYQNIDGHTIEAVQQRPANDYKTYKGSMSNHDKVYQNVIDVLCHNGVVSTSGSEALQTVAIIEKIYAAQQNR